jgi:deoxyadenosine/deoxycytidine kinase
MKIAIEGNIGSGKSSLMAAAKSISATCRESFDFFFEPLETWHDLLQKYFEDPTAWALPFTLEVLRTHDRVLEWESRAVGNRKPHCIVERSPYACRDVFSLILKHDRVFSADDMRLIETYVDLFGWKPDIVIIVDVPPHECLDRIHARGRPNEQPTYEYLKCVQCYYDKMLHTTLQGVPVYRMIQSSSESVDAFHARFALLLERLISRETSPERQSITRASGR